MNDRSSKVKRTKKPRKCPKCGHTPLADILYGEPLFDEELERAMNEGTITLGGCCITDDDPAWECTHCGLNIFRKRAK